MKTNGGSGEGTIASVNNNSIDQQISDISTAAPVQQQQQHHKQQTQSVSQVSGKAILMNQVPQPTTTQGQLQQAKPVVSPVSANNQQPAGSMSNSVTGSGTVSGGNNFVNSQQSEQLATGDELQLQNSSGMMYPRQQRHGHYHNNPQNYNKYNNNNNNNSNNHKDDDESIANQVILITVINPHYPITCDLIHQICSTHGKVNRIVIFKKNGVQAMVEFDNIESAKRAKSLLQNCDIYSGCCTLRVEIAKPVRLNVHRNDSESFDYTNPNLGTGNSQSSATETGDGSDNPQVSSAGISTYGSTRGGKRQGQGGDMMATGSGHMHSQDSQKQQQQSITSASSSQQQASAYIMGQPIESQSNANSTEPMDTFQHPEAGFNVSRGGSTSGGGGGGGGGNGNAANFVGIDPFMQSSGPQSHNMYQQRQDGSGGHQHHQHHPSHHHHHQHHHHQRIGLAGGSNGGTGSNPNHHHHHHHAFPSVNSSNSLMPGPANLSPQGTVMMVYGLSPERINCDRLFNLFCLYGNVVRVKFLRSKEGCAMVQMGDVMAVDRCVSSLNKVTLFGNELQISYSKQAFLHDVLQPFALPDGSPSFKDFMGNKNNRFKNPEVASKNRILPPSRVLHFFNAPHGISEDELMDLFKQTTEHEPVSVKIFTPKAENVKSYSGLVTFGDPAEATEALVLCNHISMPKVGVPHPYILRLCFSPPTYC